jgi:carbonic anhydrase
LKRLSCGMNCRTIFVLFGCAALLAVGTSSLVAWKNGGREIEHPVSTEPNAVLIELMAGNERFVKSHRVFSTDTANDASLRKQLINGQHPFVAMLCCADSRICPEVIFDQHVGSFFEIRNAGNVMDDDTIASMEYAVEHLHVQFLCVLGHKGCGAVEAVHQAGDKPLHDHLRALQDRMRGIMPLVLKTQDQHSADHLAWLARENAREQTKILLEESRPVLEALQQGKVRLLFGMYDMETGRVEFFDRNSNSDL